MWIYDKETRAHTQVQTSVGAKDRVETNGQTDDILIDCFTFLANADGKANFSVCFTS